jgi:hypothetical protein
MKHVNITGYGNQKKNKESLQKEWLLRYLGNYCEKALEKKYKADYNHLKASPITINNICFDARRNPTAFKYLLNLGLIKDDYINNPLFPMDEKILELLKVHAEKPSFNSEGYTLKDKSSYSSEKVLKAVTDIRENYLSIYKMKAEHLMYVFLNQTDYLFDNFKTKWKSRYRHNDTYTLFSCYPKSNIKSAEENSIRAIAETYAKEHICDVMSFILNIKIKCLQWSSDEKSLKMLNFNKESSINLETLGDKLLTAERMIKHLKRASLELKVIGRHIQKLGQEQFDKMVVDKTVKYLTMKAPLWAYGKEENSEKVRIAKILLKGTTIVSDILEDNC